MSAIPWKSRCPKIPKKLPKLGPKASDEDIAVHATKVLKITCGQTLALAFLEHAYLRCFGLLCWTNLENKFTRGNNQYPSDLTAAYSLLVNYCGPPQDSGKSKPSGGPAPSSNPSAFSNSTTSVTFAQTPDSAPVTGTDEELHIHFTCFNCNTKGHYANSCPGSLGMQMLHLAPSNLSSLPSTSNFMFAWSEGAHILPTCILLDTQSTILVFSNPALLYNICRSLTTLCVHTNGGTQISTMIGNLPNFGSVWINPGSLANILFLAKVRQKHWVTIDTATKPALCVYKADGAIMKFTE